MKPSTMNASDIQCPSPKHGGAQQLNTADPDYEDRGQTIPASRKSVRSQTGSRNQCSSRSSGVSFDALKLFCDTCISI